NIVLSFNDIEELEEFTKDYRSILHKRAKKLFKCDDDKRGSSTKDLHKKAKEYQVGNPETPYKDCLRIVGKETKKVTEIIV
ncbi:MAG: hypothetical protein ACK56F_00745, partial [bacterium]